MMTPIPAIAIDAFQNGRRRVMYATTPGVVQVPGKDGLVDAPYKAGAILLVDDRDSVIVGPVTIEGAVDFAELILEGNQRAVTDPLGILMLATAIIGFQIENDSSEPAAFEKAASYG